MICPATEANLGDGLADLPRWLASPTMLSVGSDSQVSRSWAEELRWLEYGQRLTLRQRNVAAAPAMGVNATAARLFERTLAGGAAAAGFGLWGLVAGARADLLVVDGQAHGAARRAARPHAGRAGLRHRCAGVRRSLGRRRTGAARRPPSERCRRRRSLRHDDAVALARRDCMSASDFWPGCGWSALQRAPNGWLAPSEDFVALILARPELALVDESCPAERRLHRRLKDAPLSVVGAADLAKLRDADARENYAHALAFRDSLLDAGTLEAWLLALFRAGRIATPPLFIDVVVQAIVRQLLDGRDDALEVRAAELLFRPQRITLHEGRVLAGDRETLDLQVETAGLGELGRLLVQAQAPVKGVNLAVLSDDNAPRFWAQAARADAPRGFLLDLTHEVALDQGHGLSFKVTESRSGLKALAGVLQRWVAHLLGVAVHIRPVQRIEDANWRWHVGLDAEASALLNDLYEGNEVDDDRRRRLISLFRLDFDDPAEMRADVRGRPVYLGLMMNGEQVVRLKPQNLLLNLPLAKSN